VIRPDGTPVVTGTVRFKSLDPALTIGAQTAVRAATGRWTLTVNGLVAGTYLGLINYTDPSGTHAANAFPIQFDVVQGPTPSPADSPAPTPTKTKAPVVDSCAGQIRN